MPKPTHLPLNLLDALPAPGPEEDFSTLLQRPGVRLERIVSHGHRSPEGFWYDQGHDEWVMLVQGEAALELEGQAPLTLKPGDTLLIPAHCRHRVAFTGPATVWLALHFEPTPA